jgi:hypothetical protein
MKTLRPLFFFSSLLLIVGLACSALGGGDTPAQPEQPQQPVQQPTQPPAPAPTDVPPPTAAPVATDTTVPEQPSADASQFFTEEFDSSAALENWDYFALGTGKDDDLVIEQEDDHVLFDLKDEDLYIYYMYLPYEYGDVSLTMNAQNRGRNNNNVSLVCRMNSDGTQWYEFSVESGGLWYLYAVDGKYNIIDNGGTNSLKQGKEVNEYQMACEGNEITLYINGDKIKTVTDNKYAFGDGLVGFNISSLNVLPITVEVNSFEISEP